MLPQAIAVINGKGGVGKTSITTNLSGLFAAADYRVLLVDMDPQGNAARDLGYTARSDKGAALFQAVTSGTKLEPLRDVRPGLDVICGGDLTEDMAGVLASRNTRGQVVTAAIDAALAPLAEDYDLVFIDCPPGNRLLQQMALTAAHFAIIPTKPDEASLDGLIKVAELFASVQADTNPDLRLLGVVLFAIGARSRRISESARTAVTRDLQSAELTFQAEIRLVEGPAQDCRRLGLLVHEIEAQLPEAQKKRFQLLRARREGPGLHRPDAESAAAAQALATSAPHLAGDYQRLAEELTERIQAELAVSA